MPRRRLRDLGPFVASVRLSTTWLAMRGLAAAGTWSVRSTSPIFTNGGGTPLYGGAVLDSFGGGQFVAPGGTANSTNPISNAFRGVWSPASYFPRTGNFIAEPGTNAQVGQHNGILLAYSIEQPNLTTRRRGMTTSTPSSSGLTSAPESPSPSPQPPALP